MVGPLFTLSLICLSQAAILIRFAEAPSLAICFWRLLMAGAFLLPVALVSPRNRAILHSLKRSDWMHLALCGFLLFIHFYFFFRSVQETTIANSMILFSINPIFTAIGAYWFFKERVSLHLALAGLLGLAGVIVLMYGSVGSTGQANLLGDFWSVLSALCFSAYLLAGKHIRRVVNNTTFAAAVYLQTSLYAAIAMSWSGVPFGPYSPSTWWAFLGLAIVPTLLGHALFSYCLKSMNINFMSCATLTEPILGALVANWLFHEPMTERAAIGFILTSASVVALYWESLRGGWLAKGT